MELSYKSIPPHMMEALLRYRDQHIPVGDFLQSVICNDLSGAVATADDINIKIIPIYVRWFYNEAPSLSWGSKEAYDLWLSKRKTPDINKEKP